MLSLVFVGVHLTSFGLFIIASVHGYQAGADRTALTVQWLALTGGTLVLFLVLFRLLAPRWSRRAARRASVAPA